MAMIAELRVCLCCIEIIKRPIQGPMKPCLLSLSCLLCCPVLVSLHRLSIPGLWPCCLWFNRSLSVLGGLHPSGSCSEHHAELALACRPQRGWRHLQRLGRAIAYPLPYRILQDKALFFASLVGAFKIEIRPVFREPPHTPLAAIGARPAPCRNDGSIDLPGRLPKP